MWYSPYWSKMKCFALPSISHGYIRMNVQGRESNGVVPNAEYDLACAEVSDHLRALRDARTGRAIVNRIVRTRTSAMDCGPEFPDPDLIVYYEREPADVVDSPQFGRIGPVPYARTGGHVNRGFAILKGPRFERGSTLPRAHVRDIAPTMLDLLGAPLPQYLEGSPITASRR
jgi:predicted AlkP superfamily phosphohydrolase/phosphomutase